MRAQLEKILQKFIRSHTICKGTTRCNCRLSTKPSQSKLQVEEHLQHSSYTVLKMSAASPFSLIIYGFSIWASLTAVIAEDPLGVD